MNARAMTISRVCGCVFALFFALPFAAEEANAQAADCAEFDVFTPSDGPWESATNTALTGNLSGTLAAIVASLPDIPSKNAFFQLRTSPGASSIQAANTIPADNIPLFDVNGTERQPNAGEGFIIVDIVAPTAFGGSTEEFRIYVNTVGDDLRLANLPTAKKCAAALTGTEFFLHSTDYTPYDSTATPSATTYLGFVALTDSDCNGDRTADADGLMCELNCPVGMVEDPDSNGLNCEPVAECTGDEVLNTARNECDLDCPTGMMQDPENPDMCIADDTGGDDPVCVAPQVVIAGVCSDPPETPATPAATSESDDEGFPAEDALIAYGGVFGVVLAAHFLWDGDPNAFAFSPDVGYSLTESGYSFNAGGRMDFHKDRWHLYWTAGQTNANGDFGDFRYSSGGSYAADFWTATFSENASGEIVDYDLSLSANYGEGVWKLSPVYRLHSRFEESETGRMESKTTNSLNLEGILRANRWILRPTAGFQWRGMNDFADNAKFGFSAVRNL